MADFCEPMKSWLNRGALKPERVHQMIKQMENAELRQHFTICVGTSEPAKLACESPERILGHKDS